MSEQDPTLFDNQVEEEGDELFPDLDGIDVDDSPEGDVNDEVDFEADQNDR